MTERNRVEVVETEEQQSSKARRRETPEIAHGRGPLEPHGFDGDRHHDDAANGGSDTAKRDDLRMDNGLDDPGLDER